MARQRKIEIEEDAIRAQPVDTNSTALRPSFKRESHYFVVCDVGTALLYPKGSSARGWMDSNANINRSVTQTIAFVDSGHTRVRDAFVSGNLCVCVCVHKRSRERRDREREREGGRGRARARDMCLGDSVHEPEGDSIGNCEEKEALEHRTGAKEETKKGVGGC